MANPTAGNSGHLAAHGQHVSFIDHGATAGTARPVLDSGSAAAACVVWLGSVQPTNATTDDLWWDTSAEAWKRFTGSVWSSSGGSPVDTWRMFR